MNSSDYKRLKNLSLNEKKAMLIQATKKLSFNEDKAEVEALGSIIYNLESDIKDVQTTALIDGFLS